MGCVNLQGTRYHYNSQDFGAKVVYFSGCTV